MDEPGTTIPPQNNHAIMQTDGNFVVYNPAGTALWSTGTAGTASGPMEVQDDGNLVLYNFKWQAGTYAAPAKGPFQSQTCNLGIALNAPQTIPDNKCIVSPSGQYMLWVATDGSMRIYDLAHSAITWMVGGGSPGAYASLQVDGNFVLYTADGKTALWNSGTNGTNAQRLEMGNDGRIIIYRASWNSGTSIGQFDGTQRTHPGCDIGFADSTGTIATGQCMVSPDGRFELLMQADGNLVQYDLSTNPPTSLWSAGTALSLLDPSVAFRTLYSYDALGNLLCVEQHGNSPSGSHSDGTVAVGCSSWPHPTSKDTWHPRMFTYNSLSELLTAYNPETGNTCYGTVDGNGNCQNNGYDANGNVIYKTSPQPNQLPNSTATTTFSYCYDALGRVVAKGFANSPNPAQQCSTASPYVPNPWAVYSYDQGANGIGQRTGMTDLSGSTTWSYDAMGHVSSVQRTTIPGGSFGPVTRSISYKYDLLGNVTQITYPDNTQIQYGIDSAGRSLSATDITHGLNYIGNATYAADGSIAGFTEQVGTTITNSFLYNPRAQICREMASTTGVVPTSCADSANVGNVMDFQYDFHYGTGNNGDLYTAANNKDTGRTQTFTYDLLNRLLTAKTAGTDCSIMVPGSTTQTKYWGESFTYDAWANLTGKTGTQCNAENTPLAANFRNQLAAYGYDAAGNMLGFGSNVTYAYNADSELASTGGYSYLYDGDGNRIGKSNGSTGTLYWYGSPGIVQETDLSGSPQSEYVFFSGQRIARRDLGGTTPVYYYFSNQIHSTALITDANGNIQDDADYYPWGGTLQFSSNVANHYWFSGKERDSESQLDYFGARYYGNSMGRFLTPDWSAKIQGVPYADFTDPQSLNLYGYVRDNPITKIDPDGHCVEDFCIAETTAVIAYASSPAGQRVISNAIGATLATATVIAAVTTNVGQKIDNKLKEWADFSATPGDAAGGSAGEAHLMTPNGSFYPENFQIRSSNTGTNTPANTGQQAQPQAPQNQNASAGTSGGQRGGKPFTPKGKKEVKAANAKKNGGQTTCEHCGRPTVPAQQSQAGVTPPDNETHVDHIIPQSQGGDGSPSNGQVLCRTCNLDKSDH
ncbi:MAG: RHS repeat-associated core domain-containing protein [Candidatus Angelobacter sp.]